MASLYLQYTSNPSLHIPLTMCKQYTITYTCQADCTYSVTAWSTYCEHQHKDNQQGTCNHVVDGGLRRLAGPCPIHRGMRDPRLAAADIQHPRPNTWQNAHNTGTSSRTEDRTESRRGEQRLRNTWREDENRYELDIDGLPNDPNRVRDMHNVDWLHYTRRAFNPSAHYNAEDYWNDPEPWGDMRDGGRLQRGRK